MQAVWALGNIAGDSPKCRDMVLEAGALLPLLEQLKNSKLSMLRNATWTLSNFCRGKPQPKFEQVQLLTRPVSDTHMLRADEPAAGRSFQAMRGRMDCICVAVCQICLHEAFELALSAPGQNVYRAIRVAS